MDQATVTTGLVVRNLHVSFGTHAVLRGVSFTLHEGETVAIIGRSGCGKSTLLRSIVGLLPVAAGDILLNDNCLLREGLFTRPLWQVRQDIILIAQSQNLLPHLTAEENITLGLLVVKRFNLAAARAECRRLARLLGLTDALHQYPEELSGGQAQRVHLARGLALRPQVLLLDEVTSSIDPQTTADVVDALWTLREFATERIQARILVTHLLSFAASFADRILFLHEGVIFEEGTAETFLTNAARDETRAFLQFATRC